MRQVATFCKAVHLWEDVPGSHNSGRWWLKVQVAEELRQCTEEHDSMLHERLEHEDRLKKVCSQQNPYPSTYDGLRRCDTV